MSATRGAAIGAVLVALVALAWWLPIGAWSVMLAERLRGMGATGVVLFILIYVIAEVALLPGAPFTLAAGFAYGPVGGLLVASPASVLAATVAFVLGRTVLRDWVRTKVSGYPMARALDTALEKNTFKLIFLMRLSPLIPFNILNYALGLSDARIGRYVVASFVGMLPGTWLYAYLGSLATTAATLTDETAGAEPQKLVLTLVGFAATAIVVILVTRAAQRALKEELAGTTS
jgi:uncharacterized membrane protein YdjX (TVP38/TMEM64 family)